MIRTVRYDHPDAAALIEQVQQEYVVRYGSRDGSAVDPADFAPPRGVFLVDYLDDVPIACGGWRPASTGVRHEVEIKRMFVAPAVRGRGLARALLAELEHTAWQSGAHRMVLETGAQQPEAIALYRSCGYTDVPGFGHYADEPLSIHLGKTLEAACPSTRSATASPTSTPTPTCTRTPPSSAR